MTQFLNSGQANQQSLVTTYGYDEIGNRISQTDANGHVTLFAYDQLGRRSSRTLPLGMSETYGYDPVGNLSSHKDFNGHTTTYQYDPMNRLTKKTADAFFSTGACAGGVCGANQISFTYTPNGRRVSMSDASGTTSYTYDSRDRLLTKATPFGTLTYTYDAAGNTLSLSSSNAGGASMTYAYDPLNRLASVTDASGVTSYSFDAVGNLTGYEYPNGVSTTYAYDPLNRLTTMQSTCGVAGSAAALGCGTAGTPIASYAYTIGPAGNRLSVAELSGRSVAYGYDDLYRLTSENVACGTGIAGCAPGSVAYTYDNVGNRLQRSSSVAALPATGLLNYDANDRTSTDPYDTNGNLLNGGVGTNVYDFENRLVAAGAVKLVYDGDGNRVKETVATTTTSFLVADQNLTGYAQVLDELQGGAVSRTYSYGLSLISERQPISGTQTTSFYGFDGHGSVRFLTSSTGAVTDTYDYDAFGNLISSTGTTPNNYLFAGEQFDPALGIYYNRARYYDQRQGRFWTMDTYEGDPESPYSLHKYTYSHNAPINFLDPSGNADFTIAGQTFSLSISNVLRGIAVNSLKGALIGAVIGGTDAALGGNDVIQGALKGAIGGALIGPFAKIRVAAALMGLFGFAIGGESGIDAIEKGDTAQGFFRLGLAVFSAVAAVTSITTILGTPGSVVRAPLDIARQIDYPEPTVANDGVGSIGQSPLQNTALAKDIRLLRFLGARDIRVNQEQVNAEGLRVGRNRPDLQATLFFKLRVYIEYDSADSLRAAGHHSRILSNDPWSIIILKRF